MRRLVLGGLVLVLLSGVAFAATWGQYQGFSIVRVTIDGQTVQSDVPAINFYGRTMVPLRVISETLGVKVTWDQENTTAIVQSGPTYASWNLTTSETLDAIAWARACRSLDRMQLMPSYYHDGGEVGLEIQTPWACVAVDAQLGWQQGIGAFSIERMKEIYSGKLHVWVAKRRGSTSRGWTRACRSQ